MTYTQSGSSGQPAAAEGYLQIWHPVGFLIAEYNVSMLLSGFQSLKASFVWTPSSAHSALDENGYLVGGIILRGIVDGGLADDTESNNELDRFLPVAMWNDPMENGFCGDVDGDNIIDCTNQLLWPTYLLGLALDMILMGSYLLTLIVTDIGEWIIHPVKKERIIGVFLVLEQIMPVIDTIDSGGVGLLHSIIVMNPDMV